MVSDCIDPWKCPTCAARFVEVLADKLPQHGYDVRWCPACGTLRTSEPVDPHAIHTLRQEATRAPILARRTKPKV